MTAELPAPLTNALEQVRQWTLRGDGVLAPEATLVDWLALALAGSGTDREPFCKPFEILSELTLHTEDLRAIEDQLRHVLAGKPPRFENTRGRIELSYDLAVLAPGERPTRRFADRPRLRSIFEVKAANSARALERPDVTYDLCKLAAGAAWHEYIHGESAVPVMVLITTALDPKKRPERLNVIEGWHRRYVDKPPVRGVWLATLGREALSVDLLGAP